MVIIDTEESKRVDNLYDDILVALLDILNYLHQISSKELIAKFIQDREVSMKFALHFFLT